jgi:hypothetical protein
MAKSAPLNARTIRDLYDSGMKPIRADLQEYWLNHAFLHGHQWLYYSPQTRRLEDIPRDPDRVQATINRIWPNSRIIISKSLQRELTFEVIPDAADDESVRGASLGESVIEATRREHDWEEKREQLHWAVWKGGTAALCVDWDPDGGEPVLPAETPEDSPITGGDTIETVLSVADFVCEPGVRNGEQGRWWIKASVLPPEQVQATFGMAKKPEADATAGTTPFQRKMLTSHYAGGDSEMLADLTLVLTYYERPTRCAPRVPSLSLSAARSSVAASRRGRSRSRTASTSPSSRRRRLRRSGPERRCCQWPARCRSHSTPRGPQSSST